MQVINNVQLISTRVKWYNPNSVR